MISFWKIVYAIQWDMLRVGNFCPHCHKFVWWHAGRISVTNMKTGKESKWMHVTCWDKNTPKEEVQYFIWRASQEVKNKKDEDNQYGR